MNKRIHWLMLPPVVMVLTGSVMYLIRCTFDMCWSGNTRIAVLLTVLSLFILLSACWHFVRAKTTLHPQHYHQVKILITQGIFKYSRNPIYVGQLLLLAAWAVWLGGLAVWIGWVGYFIYLNNMLIPNEEIFLRARFGTDYISYCRQVRRWL